MEIWDAKSDFQDLNLIKGTTYMWYGHIFMGNDVMLKYFLDNNFFIVPFEPVSHQNDKTEIFL